MTLTVSELNAADLPELQQFLLKQFGVGTDCVPFTPEALQWKYLSSGDGFELPKSFIARDEHEIVAHIGLCYRNFVLGEPNPQTYRAAHPIDWCSNSKYPGVGATLMMKVFGQAPIQYVIGGTAIAQRMFRVLGFQVVAQLAEYRKILRPAYPLLRDKGGLTRRLARSARNEVVAWRHRGDRPQISIELQEQRSWNSAVDRFSQQPDSVLSKRDAKLLNHFLAYPAGGFSGYLINRQQACIGLAVARSTHKGNVTHGSIAECLLGPDAEDCWSSAYRALGDQLRSQGVDVITTYSNTESSHRRLASAGFHPYRNHEVFLRDRQGLLREMPQLHLSKLDADHCLF